MKLLFIALFVLCICADCDYNCKYLQTCEVDLFVNDIGRIGTFIYPIGYPEQRLPIKSRIIVPTIVQCYVYNGTITGICPEECISPTSEIFSQLWIIFGFSCLVFILWNILSF